MPTEHRPAPPNLLTDSMTVKDLASYFGCARNTMSAVLKGMPEADRFGRKWRVPILRMPLRCRRERGFL